MSQPVVSTNTTAIFVVRFWRETTVSEVRWRGRIEHVQSKEGVSFLDLEGMLSFIQRFCVWVDLRDQPTREET